MKYIWINPVTERMYETSELDAFLKCHEYERVVVSGDWINVVKQKYKEAVCQTERTVIDMRCPKIRDVVEEYSLDENVKAPDIHPILIHCAEEISEREDLRGQEKVIITPCQALADQGNALGLKETTFMPWNSFMKSTGQFLQGKQQSASPIPPGFFEGTIEKTISITGEEEIREYFENFKPGEVQLVEMLFCKDGCHNGDGVLMHWTND